VPPVEENTFISKADLLIAAVTLLAQRIEEVRDRIDTLSAIGEENYKIALADQQRDEVMIGHQVPRRRRDGAL